jgi:hypothetical protein
MNRISRLFTLAITVASLKAHSQGTFVYDQQSSTDETPLPGAGSEMTLNTPIGQSFTPSFTSVGFVKLNFSYVNPPGIGATVYVNLHSDSLTGPILGTTDPVMMLGNFAGVTNFSFTAPVAVTPGTVYYLEPIESAGGPWNIIGGPYNYPGGTFLYDGGIPEPGGDLWFREGIIPEPSSLCLVLVGGAVLVGAKLSTEGHRVRD